MEKNLNYQIIPDKKLIIEYYSGSITLNDLILFQHTISFNRKYNPNFNIIHDFREASLSLNEADVMEYIQFIKNSSKLCGVRRTAHVTSSPKQVVAITLFNLLKNDLPVNAQVVSTIYAAVNWVGLDPEDKGMVDFHLNHFRQSAVILK